jgi:hypothetical protein
MVKMVLTKAMLVVFAAKEALMTWVMAKAVMVNRGTKEALAAKAAMVKLAKAKAKEALEATVKEAPEAKATMVK